jgi:hypothetical protein
MNNQLPITGPYSIYKYVPQVYETLFYSLTWCSHFNRWECRSKVGISFTGYAQGPGYSVFKTKQEAIAKTTEWDNFILTHNDQAGLQKEYCFSLLKGAA